MNSILLMGIFLAVIGAAYFADVKAFIPPEYRCRDWTKKYAATRGLQYLCTGLVWLAAALLNNAGAISDAAMLGVLLAVSVPVLVWVFVSNRRFKRLYRDRNKTDGRETEL